MAKKNADCDCDGEVGSNDAVSLMRFLVHLINILPEPDQQIKATKTPCNSSIVAGRLLFGNFQLLLFDHRAVENLHEFFAGDRFVFIQILRDLVQLRLVCL